MTLSHTPLLLLYCLAIAAFSLIGGLLPGWIRMTHTTMQVIMSLVSGLMLGVAFYHLLPHSAALLGGLQGVDNTVWWLMIGLITMLLLLRVFHFHEHDFSSEALQYDRDAGYQGKVHGLSWVGIAFGLGLHTLIDGVALGAAMQGGMTPGGLMAFGVFLAILLHKPLGAMSIVTIMEAGGWSRAARLSVNLVFALMCPLGALLFFFGVDVLGNGRNTVVAAALAFSAGVFICIALSDLLPEVHFHSHDKMKLSIAFLLGIAIAYGIGSFETDGMHVADH
ncbi:MAG: ZIP family metal transporter [Halioglobus sp.]|nr:ZIP family metal transporter [Halioglobus sp.]